jgi:uncharacterized protein with NAD-binding domain and iron-sulfur cluster
MKKVYYIHVSDPRSSEYHPEGQEYIDYSKGAFLDEEVAKNILGMMQLFQEKGDECRYSIRSLELHEETSFDDWMDNKGPSSERARAKREQRAG